MPLVSVTLSQSPLGLLWYPLGHLELAEADDVDESARLLLPPSSSSSSSPPSPSPPSSAPPPSDSSPELPAGASHPIPSLSPSNPCGSGDSTLKLVPSTSSQFNPGGGGGMQKSGYEELHAASPSSSSPSGCPTSDAAISSNESNICPTDGGNRGGKLPNAVVISVVVVELPS